MPQSEQIPNFALFGETEFFPDIFHVEKIIDRAQGHGWVIRPHRHHAMAQVVLLEEGTAEANLEGVTRDLSPGSFLFLPSGHVHGFRFSAGTDGFVLSFPESSLARMSPMAGRASFLPATQATGEADDALCDIVRLLDATLTTTGHYRDHVALGLAQAILAKVAAGAESSREAGAERKSSLVRLDQLIAQNLGRGWQPKDYARALNVTTGHLSRICRSVHGAGARAYVDAAVMREAARNLAFTNLPVAEIGYRLGYSDPTHFSRRFRAIVGQTPTDYRKRSNSANI